MIRTDYSVFNYLTIAEVDKLWGLYVTGSGYADVPPHTPYPPTKHPDTYMFDWQHGRILPEFQVLYITRGRGIFESEYTEVKKIEEGNVFFLFPGVWHRYMPEKEVGWKEHWVSFNGTQPLRLLEAGIFSPEKPIFDIGLHEEIITLYQQILDHMESEGIGFKEIISALTYQIIAKIFAIDRFKRFSGRKIETIIHKAKVYMLDRIDQHISMEKLAYELGVGYSWFRRIFRHYTNLAPGEYFLCLKLNKAKELLVNTSLSIKEIAMLTGFESQFYFSKFFKQRMGMSPLQFRKFSRGEEKKG